MPRNSFLNEIRRPLEAAAIISTLFLSVGCSGVRGETDEGTNSETQMTIEDWSPGTEVTPSTSVPPETTEAPPTTLPPSRSIYIVGDSLTQGVQADSREGRQLDDALRTNGWEDVLINAECGRPFSTSTGNFDPCGEVTSAAAGLEQINIDQEFIRGAGAVLILLGTNNVSESPVDYIAQARTLVARVHEINPIARVIMPTIYVERRGGNYHDINQALIAEAPRMGVAIADFASQAQGHYSLEGCTDGIHPCESGKHVLVSVVAAVAGSPG